MLDILIRGGTVIAGTGRPARRADVAIAGDRIEAIDLLPGAGAARVIDATGHVVAPGFVDMHSPADFVLPGLPTADSKVHQGFRYPRGIPWVLVNGEPVIAGAQHTGSRPGRVLAR